MVVVAGLLLVSSVGSASAALVITGRQIKDGSVTGRDIKNSSLAGADVKDGSLALRDFNNTSIRGPRGPAGPAGQQGQQGQQGSQGPVGPSGTATLQYVSASRDAGTGPAGISVPCPPNTHPVGGGGSSLANSPLVSSAFTDDHDGWAVVFDNSDPTSIFAWAVCAA